MTEHEPDQDGPDDAIFMRTFELDGEETVEAWVWPPQEDPDGPATDCWYRIIGIGNEKARYARGIDGLQALTIALQFIALDLYNSPEYKAGRLTFHGKRDLILPELPGWHLGQETEDKADIIRGGSSYSIVRMPDERFARLAFEANYLRDIVEALETGDVARTGRVARSLREVFGWYEAVCKEKGLTLPYLD